MIVGSISAPTIKATSLSDLRPSARHMPQLSAMFKGPFALNDDGQGGSDNPRRCDEDRLLRPEDATGLTQYFGICNIAFGMPGGTTQETERVMPDLLIVTPGTQLKFLVSAYAGQNTLNGGIHEVVVYDNGTNLDTLAGIVFEKLENPPEKTQPPYIPCPAATPSPDPRKHFWAGGCQNGVDLDLAASGAGHRLWNGPDVDHTFQEDRVAGAVDTTYQFNTPGTYLIICNIRNHFLKRGMHMYVEVKAAAPPDGLDHGDDTKD
jgi:hypothetical protein